MGEVVDLAIHATADTFCFGHRYALDVRFVPPLKTGQVPATLYRDNQQVGPIQVTLKRVENSDVPEFGLHIVPADLVCFEHGEFNVGNDVESYGVLFQIQDFILRRLADDLTDKVVRILYGEGVTKVSEGPPWNLFPTAEQRVQMAKTALEQAPADDEHAFERVVFDTVLTVAEDITTAVGDWLGAVEAGQVQVDEKRPSDQIKTFADSVLMSWSAELDD